MDFGKGLGQKIRAGLRDWAKEGIPAVVGLRHADDMREKNQIQAALGEVQHGAMGNLGRETEAGVRPQLTARVHPGQHDLHAQGGEEGRVKRIQRVRRQRPGDADAQPVSGGWVRGGAKQQLAALLHQIRRGGGACFPLPHIFIKTAPAPERKPPADHPEPVNAAKHFAGPAGEPTDELEFGGGEVQQFHPGV